MTIRIALTPGEPAGIGPDITLQLTEHYNNTAEIVIIADADLLAHRAQQLGYHGDLAKFDPKQPRPGELTLYPIDLVKPCQTGQLDTRNAAYVLATLQAATQGCLDGLFHGLVTGPVHKGILNDAGYTFTGHTEWLAKLSQAPEPVMLFVTPRLRVALVTTHIPLTQVSRHITTERLTAVLTILKQQLQYYFALPNPRISVCGLNPHAGEQGHLGREEIDIIAPVLNSLRQQNYQLIGPLPADTAFTPEQLTQCDVVVTMYHDQGLPVLKYQGFGQAINVTLGLPFLRTSVDHGTALSLAGTGKANANSLIEALNLAISLIKERKR